MLHIGMRTSRAELELGRLKQAEIRLCLNFFVPDFLRFSSAHGKFELGLKVSKAQCC